ncbi:MAG: hypothetical protein GY854_33745 [Deltaproteobacteria bacterium]|nr:hypothetical protein [Deltaproteobacteria bacterium]
MQRRNRTTIRAGLVRQSVLLWYGLFIWIIEAGCGTAQTANAMDASCDCPRGEDGGCTEDIAEDTEEDDSDNDSNPTCPPPIADECSAESDKLPLMLEASQIGSGAFFTRLSEYALSGERREGDERVIFAIDGRLNSRDVVIWEFETPLIGVSELRLPSTSTAATIGVGISPTGDDWAHEDVPIVLLCDGDSCSLYRARYAGDPSDGEVGSLVPVDNGDIIMDARGLWTPEIGDLACVFGDGIACFDGQDWSEMVSGWTDDLRFKDMHQYRMSAVAVGDSGLTAISGFPEWDAWSGTAYPDLLTVTARYDGYLAGGRGGALINPVINLSCTVTDEDIVALSSELDHGIFMGVTDSGRAFNIDGDLHALNNLCFTGQRFEDFIDMRTILGGIFVNDLVLTKTALYGTTNWGID